MNYYKFDLRFISKLSLYFRESIFDIFMETMAPRPFDNVLDVGVTPDEKHLESNFFESFYPYKNMITATSIEDASFLEDKYPGLRFIETNGSELPFKDNEFEIAFSNAVVEHVGNKEQQKKFIEEVFRVSKKSFITTPNKLYPLEFHTLVPFLHYLPSNLYKKTLNFFGEKFYSQNDNLNLLTQREFIALFPSTSKIEIKKFKLLYLPANLIAIQKDKFK